MELIKEKKFFLFYLFLFLTLNLLVIIKFGFYNDDWGFFVTNELSKAEHALSNLTLEIGVKRHINYPIYVLMAYLGDFPKILYFLTFCISCLIIYFKFLICKKFLSKFEKHLLIDHYLILIILIWYFLPFNFGGQFWLTGVHIEISYLLFLVHLFFLIRNNIFYSILFLFLSFNSYENLYFIYLPFVIIFYIYDLINREVFKKYFFLSLLVQIFFLIYKKREMHNINLLDVFTQSIENLIRFFYSIYTPSFYYLGSFLTILSVVILFICFYVIYKNRRPKNLKFYSSFVILLSTIPLNSAVLTIGTYGYTGNGIFSRTMFGPSITIFFIFLLFFSSNKKTFYSLWFILLFTISGFVNESNNWIKSKKFQENIVNDKIFKEIDEKRNLVLFHGPCYVNGVEIFNASWDLDRYLKEKEGRYLKSLFVPIQNWDVFISDLDPRYKKKEGQKYIHIHTYIYEIYDYEQILILNFYNETIKKIDTNFSEINKIDNQLKYLKLRKDCHIGNNYFKIGQKMKEKLFNKIF